MTLGKNSLTTIGHILCALLFLFSSCRQSDKNIDETQVPREENITRDITNEAVLYADSVVARMTLEQRVGQCLMPAIMGSSDKSTLNQLTKFIEDFHVGGVVVMSGDTTSVRLISSLGKEAKIPLFIAIDAEWGLGMRLSGASVYPKNRKLAREADENFMFDYGGEVAKECNELGINMILGPVVDITESQAGVIGNRSFGGNPSVVSELGIAYGKGLESGGIISVAKHFPGHGSTFGDSHLGVVKTNRNISQLDSIDLKPFRDYVKSGLSGIMAGHIQSLALDPGGNAATVSIDMLSYLLRDEMGFKGLILTDAFDMGGAKNFSAVDAVNAGADIILCPKNVIKDYEELLEAIKTGKLTPVTLEERCKRILFYKYIFSIAGF